MHVHTLKRMLKTRILTVAPAKPGSGITLNGVLACPRNVARGDSCVVLRDGAKWAFTVEHPLSALRMSGIHDAVVQGIEEKWDFVRPQHRAAYALKLKPSAVLGSPEGTISGGLMELIDEDEIVNSGTRRNNLTLAASVSTTTEDGGQLEIHPAGKETGLDIELYLATLGPLKARFDPEDGLLPIELRRRVGGSVTGFIKGPVEEALYHALGDIIGDLAGTGGIDNAFVKARFMRGYHRLTMSAVKIIKIIQAD